MTFIRVIALFVTLAVLSFLLRGFLGLENLGVTLFFVILVGVMGLLIRVSLLQGNALVWRRGQLIDIRAHVCLHLVPFSYLALVLKNSPSLAINCLYFLPVAAFFYSGRRTWRAIFGAFRSKIYKLFFLGNTGMLVVLSLLLGLGLLSQQGGVVVAFQQLFMLYFSVHLLIVGAVVTKIETDISTYRTIE